MEPAHEYSVLLSRTTGEDLAEVPVRVDLAPARQWGLFEGLRRGAGGRCEAVVEPAWSDEHGPPFVQGLRVTSGGGSFDGVLDAGVDLFLYRPVSGPATRHHSLLLSVGLCTKNQQHPGIKPTQSFAR